MKYRKSEIYRCWNIFVVPKDYKIEYHEYPRAGRLYK